MQRKRGERLGIEAEQARARLVAAAVVRAGGRAFGGRVPDIAYLRFW